jgi:hypothetical protein
LVVAPTFTVLPSHADAGQVGRTAQVDEAFTLAQAQLHGLHQALAAGQVTGVTAAKAAAAAAALAGRW